MQEQIKSLIFFDGGANGRYVVAFGDLYKKMVESK